jgi:hypothetical protein
MAQVNRDYISFGSLFCHFAVEAILRNDDYCDELQVLFYALNDGCGPCRNQSVAEFPISVGRFKQEYSKQIKMNGRMTLEAFLGMVINTTFEDNRASGYGMTAAYKPWTNKEDDKIENSDGYDGAMLAWSANYGAFTRPMIEMYIETAPAADVRTGGDPLDYLMRSEKDNGGDIKLIKRIHIYDKANDPLKKMSNVIRDEEHNTFIAGSLVRKDIIRGTNWFKEHQKSVMSTAAMVEAATKTGVTPAVTANASSTGMPEPGTEGDYIDKRLSRTIAGGYTGLKEYLSGLAPKIDIGANGTMVITANLASKTDGAGAAINMIRQQNAYKNPTGPVPPPNGLSDVNGLPLRTYPAQLTMQTMGCPQASLYQQYFIDFKTGTTLDTLYNCTALKHSITPGKFTTDWTFMYTGGYGSFGGAQTVIQTLKAAVESMIPTPVMTEKTAKK